MKMYLLTTNTKEELYTKEKLVLDFYETMIKNNPEYEYKYLNSNIKNLKISPIRFRSIEFKKKGMLAYYNCNRNKIKYVKDKKEKSLPHELMHMASTVKQEDGTISSGFSQSNNTGNTLVIGKRLNEGYTQLLSERYFSDIASKSYPIEKLIVAQLENIIGKEKMEQMYFKADLYSLIEELSKYKKENDVITFIYSVDIMGNIYKKFNLITHFDLLRETYLNIINFLTSIKLEQLKNETNEKEIIKEAIKNYINSFIFILNTKKEKIRYDIINTSILETIYNKFCNEIDGCYKSKTYLK